MTPNSKLLARDTCGIYAPMRALERCETFLTNKGTMSDDIENVLLGPNRGEDYWECWDDIMSNCNLLIDGVEYAIVQQGDIWAVPLSEIYQIPTE